ncbi:hypothetical protein [Bradyrhizobium sp. LTSP857]|uniref:hypothetical protein n=1 Tax=Bradyrhizobium sp. LTSP857 TaxID=1619231 RepID=UPI0005DC0468|nr:hypothetical protein [Bradyrhizobium sp. LTSP857]KJC36458.1 hypothetical protein UP06_32560 [Bradyrhizobium sp. LTSP857]
MYRIFLLIVAIGLPHSASAEPMRLPQGCVPGAGPEQRQRCDDVVSQQLNSSSQSTPLDGGWRLVKTRDPNGGANIVAVMRTADTSRSDLNLAGLSLRCSGNGTEVVLTLLEQQPRASHPMVTLTVGSDRVQLEASVNQSAESLVLPQAATALAAGPWLTAPELTVEIATTPVPTRGTIPLTGLANGMRALRSSCALR